MPNLNFINKALFEIPCRWAKCSLHAPSINVDDTTTRVMQGLFCIVFQVCWWYSDNNTIVGFIERKIDTNPLMRLSPRRESPRTGRGRHLKSARQGITKVGGMPA